jgi:SIR2-like domain
MTMGDELLIKDLQAQIERDQVMAIVGAGVAIGATNNQLASWTGLLEDGVDRCCAVVKPLPVGWRERVLSEIRSGDLDDLLSAAEKVSRKLDAPSGGEYRRWLHETVGSLKAPHPGVIKALHALGVRLATTNYDGLIEEVTGLQPVTWTEGWKVESLIRGDDKGVLHLHGYWDKPESVVLGIRSYEEVMGNAHAQLVLQVLQTTKTLLFVGCGAGLKDPNFGSLLRWTGTVFSQSQYRRFRLAKESEVNTLQAEHPTEQRIFVLSFGNDHTDLEPFLRKFHPHISHPKSPPVSVAEEDLGELEANARVGDKVAMQKLSMTDSKKAFDILASIVQMNPDDENRRNAVMAISNIKDDRKIALLGETLVREKSLIAEACANALGRSRDSRAEQYLIRAIGINIDSLTAQKSAAALGLLPPSAESMRALVHALNRGSPQGEAAKQSLVGFGLTSAAVLRENLHANLTDEGLRLTLETLQLIRDIGAVADLRGLEAKYTQAVGTSTSALDRKHMVEDAISALSGGASS